MLTEGQQSYTPTRLQWLAVVLNSTSIIDPTIFQRGLSVEYVPDSKKDTIIMFFEHPDYLSQEQVDRLIAVLKNKVLEVAKSFGWDSWIKVEVNVNISK